MIGAEALIRWHHPQRGLLAPGEFLPMIEDHLLAVEMGDWVIRTALADDMAGALKSGSQDRPLLDPHQCRFGVWLQRSGYLDEPGFGPIDMLHRQVHQLALALCELQDGGHHEEAVQGIEELYALRERLLAKLNAYID